MKTAYKPVVKFAAIAAAAFSVVSSIQAPAITLAYAEPAGSHVLAPITSGATVYSNEKATLDVPNVSEDCIMVEYTGSVDKTKVQTTKSGSETYTYDLNSSSVYKVFPLSEDSDSYSMKVFENIQGNQYSQAFSQSVDASIANQFGPFLYPNQYMNFNAASATVQTGTSVTASAVDQLGMVSNAYNYVVNNVTCDTTKAGSVQSDYLPNVDVILAQEKDIRFDYTALMTVILRSQNVPTRLVVGYTGSLHHTWVNVYLEGQGRADSIIYFDDNNWRLMDPAFASSNGQSQEIMWYIGNGSNYRTKYSYQGEAREIAKKGEAYYRYSYEELLAFCLQISLLLEAAVPPEEGLVTMAEDTAVQSERDMLLYVAEGVELGDPFFKVMEDTGVFLTYVVRMAKLSQQTGTMGQMMKSLFDYYEKEYRLLRAIKNTITYPVMMVVMLSVVLFVLFSKVVPVFNKAYEQLGARMPPVAALAMRLGGWLSGGAFIVGAVLALVLCGVWTVSKFDKRSALVERSVSFVKDRSKIALAVANRRFISVLVLTLKSGMELEKGMDLAKELAENENVTVRIGRCSEQLQMGKSYYQATKDTGLFSGFYTQMIKVETGSGHLDSVMDKISQDYEEMVDIAIGDMIARFGPTIVTVLAMSVGLVLLSVMLPLVGVSSTIE